jgi:hypothetical protein
MHMSIEALTMPAKQEVPLLQAGHFSEEQELCRPTSVPKMKYRHTSR